MGSSESKMCGSKQVKPEPAVKNMRPLVDPRSPSASVDRTPIQVRCLKKSHADMLTPNYLINKNLCLWV